ncbi:hypothetical protein [Halomonas colorata]|uniref:hypothetical protein n=1 Tax=Halomonas colorata TaxID=2742615 RepID=UPI001866E319|nr:hypothetical protein [Halomonas colorata]
MKAPNAISHVPKMGDDRATEQFSVSVTSQEKNLIDQIASTEIRSRSATTRMLILRGLSQYKTESLIAD